ncbi:MAG: M28 family peptidase [Gemmatimonadota bacterium]
MSDGMRQAGGVGPDRRGSVDIRRLRAHVGHLEGERHPHSSPEALEEALRYSEAELVACLSHVRRHAFDFRGSAHHNVIGELEGVDPAAARVLIGAHVDTVEGTPGADDNASGVAGVLEAARVLSEMGEAGWRPAAPLEFAIFNLEERQRLVSRVGSRRWAAARKGQGVRYAGAFIFEMIGFRTFRAGSQKVPVPIRWMDIPRTGHFLACVGDGQSGDLVTTFVEAAEVATPNLEVATLTVPLRGWPVPATRRSDNASFWSEGWPALMLTDTANLRNPHYHGASDRIETLDFPFMASVVAAAVEAAVRLADTAG